MALTKMTIRGVSKAFVLQINPNALKFNKSIKYTDINVDGIAQNVVKYDAHEATTLTFDFIFDATGVASPKTESIDKTIEEFEKTTYKLDASTHEPPRLTVSWGTTVFKCYLTSLSYDYTLFSPSGEPLRVKVSVSFTNSTSLAEAEKEANKNSPDMTHAVTLKAGESIAWWCYKIYGDASYCVDIAKFNSLQGFRNVAPGTQILFPPLVRDGG
jgi:hypothetical protein